MEIIQKISLIIGRLLNVVVVALLALMSILIFAQVLGRFVFKNGLFWAEELARFSMVTMVYLGAGLACKYRDHIKVTIVEEMLKGRIRKIYRIVIALISIGFLSILTYYGFSVLGVVRDQISANMQISMSIVYVMIPIGAAIMILYLLIEIIEIIVLADKGEKPA
ncbi:MAG: TRAP transporter small permease [Treponema sp.]|jgi:TRAP-type C4-dicarboxylate transport system permease small subunit|nr:TRAP transporter small permease [Treponema sp.]